ncbi:PH domain-containing protein [Pyricularia oryzae 70-15]|uniref:PH domain-containing protein n=1 Tax=Pyricularia oryzae (strain 70-15 / ATCC MYA-4617 / FGSC 8958) TaxID=242507 RepID=G4MTT8_PYRO7|nr:PH domain-containing protein [Pyricularia oryzae 70-15]EHA53927.1 PH domain-containing protein [Pyricularia oryzae 70-15]
MARNRVLSFVSQFSAAGRDHNNRTPTPTSNSPPRSNGTIPFPPLQTSLGHSHETTNSVFSPTPSSPTRPDFTASPVAASLNGDSPPDSSPRTGRQRANSRPLSMVQTYTPPVMDVNEDTIPELQPIFTFLNNHSNKLYQEGYFLKLDDQNSQGRPNPDRTWTECFAQLVGTVLSLWDAAELDAAGEHGEVLPKFINLTDASIKMIESLPTRSNDEQPLQNILSISTAGRNRYLLHFNSHHSLIQWTAGIRLAMFEHTTLQEAYTGALIAGKGKTLNNIGVVMERSRLKTEDWVRVRFGAGVPWRRCWCVITPPDEKEYQKQQKELKKRSPYDRSPVPLLKGDIKFYDTRKEGKKQKKAKPIASISDANAAYAIYPQAKSLIDASTLLKIEGNITIHSDPPSSTEGFVFIMPESHPGVSGFEMLLRYLFPTWDTFGLYGRPGRLIASVLDQRSLMFGMPKHKKYGYLEILDVTSLILSDGSGSWSEKEWRRRLKELTAARMTAMDEDMKANGHSRSASRRSARLSIGPGSSVSHGRPRVNFADESDTRRTSRSMTVSERPSHRNDSAPPAAERQRVPSPPTKNGHSRNVSDTRLETQFEQMPYRHTPGFDSPVSVASPSPMNGGPQARGFVNDLASTPERLSSEDELPPNPPPRDFGNMERMQTPEPVHPPPAFSHAPSSRPAGKPYHSPELRRANSRLSSTTLAQLANAGGVKPESYKDEFGRTSSESSSGSRPVQGDPRSQAVHAHVNSLGITANSNRSREAINQSSDRSTPTPPGQPPGPATPRDPGSQLHKSPLNQAMVPPSPQEMESQRSHPRYESRTGSIPSSGPVHRKPLPQQAHHALAQITRQDTQRSETSNYDDEDSTTGSHDYASTTSAESVKSVERPRMGVLKTVGAEQQAQLTNAEKSYDIPQIDFGPTINYASTPTPRSKTPTPLSNNESHGSRARSPNISLSPSPGQTHHRQGSSDTLRKMAWQPGAIAGSSDRPGALTPEQYVQQKAAAASATPLYAHSRSPSSNTLTAMRNNTPTPPLHKRSSSYDMLRLREGHSRSNSADLLRPGSQGALTTLGYGSGDVPARMSPREQEHIARGSGGHPVSMATNNGSMQPGGLVGVIQAREREKAEIKQGVSSALAYEAKNRQEREMRQQQQQQLQYTSQAAYGAHSQPGFAGGVPSMYSGHVVQPASHWGGPAAIPRGEMGYVDVYGQPELQPSPQFHSHMQGSPASQYRPASFSRPWPRQGQAQGVSPGGYATPPAGPHPSRGRSEAMGNMGREAQSHRGQAF